MRNILILLLLLMAVSHRTNAQYLHTPEEMSRIMEQSQLRYIIDTLSQAKSNKQFPLIEKGWWAVPTMEGIQLERREEQATGKAAADYEKGIRFYQKEKYQKAIELCEKAHNHAPGDTEIVKRIGRAYVAIEKIEVAATWFEKALELNRIDFEAHFLLADVYTRNQTRGKALYHITMAHLLNRNHPDIYRQLLYVYKEFDQPFGKWYFAPSYHLTKVDDKDIRIVSDTEPWTAYANCKAVWQYEPGYREKMKNLSSAPSEKTEEKECLLNTLIAYEKLTSDKSIYPELATLARAVPDQKVDFFILYEIESRAEPLLVHQLAPEQLEALANYVMHYRSIK
ncbi:MAG: hypothetical protein AAFO94_08600 [Bacteroidota bacterium]